MTTREMLTQAVAENPADADRRLVLADCLDEEGAHGEAEWLRLDVVVGTGEFIDPFAFNRRERLPAPRGVEPYYNARVKARTGKEPVSMTHRLQRGRGRRR
jgi:uncharacterized protein (TIGR02996 family)